MTPVDITLRVETQRQAERMAALLLDWFEAETDAQARVSGAIARLREKMPARPHMPAPRDGAAGDQTEPCPPPDRAAPEALQGEAPGAAAAAERGSGGVQFSGGEPEAGSAVGWYYTDRPKADAGEPDGPVYADPEPETWEQLVARVDAGESISAVSLSARVNPQRLAGKVSGRRRRDPALRRAWTDEDKVEAWRLHDEEKLGPTEVAARLARTAQQVKVYLWNVRQGKMRVPGADAADAEWAPLVARVLAGEKCIAVARAAGVDARRLNGRVQAARQNARRVARAYGIPSETEASTPQGADAPGITGGDPAPAGAEGVGEDGADPSQSPAAEAPEEAEAASAPEAAAGENPAPSEPEPVRRSAIDVPAVPVAPAPEATEPAQNIPDPIPEPEDDAYPPLRMPWGPADDARLLREAMATRDLEAIADALDRSEEDVAARLDELCPESRNQSTIGAVLRRLTGTAEPDWISLCGRVEKGEAVEAVAAEAGVTVEAFRIRLDRRRTKRALEEQQAAAAAFWTPANDLALVEEICRGNGGPDRAAQRLGVPRDRVMARWAELLPTKGYREQVALLARLRKQVGA